MARLVMTGSSSLTQYEWDWDEDGDQNVATDLELTQRPHRTLLIPMLRMAPILSVCEYRTLMICCTRSGIALQSRCVSASH